MYLISSTCQHLVHLPNGGMLIPGLNEVEDEQWDLAKKNAVIQTRIEMGHFEVISAPEKSQSEDGEESEDKSLGYESDLKKLKVPVALKLVKDTLRKDLLEKWDRVENRDPIKKAIAAQLKLIDVPLREEKDE